MLDYFVFFGLIALGTIFVLIRPKTEAQQHQRTESPIERRLLQALTTNGYYVSTQHRIGKYRADLYLPAYRLVIECDGKAYHSSPKQRAHDRRRDAYMRREGYKVLRFRGRQIYRDMPRILRQIEKET